MLHKNYIKNGLILKSEKYVKDKDYIIKTVFNIYEVDSLNTDKVVCKIDNGSNGIGLKIYNKKYLLDTLIKDKSNRLLTSNQFQDYISLKKEFQAVLSMGQVGMVSHQWLVIIKVICG